MSPLCVRHAWYLQCIADPADPFEQVYGEAGGLWQIAVKCEPGNGENVTTLLSLLHLTLTQVNISIAINLTPTGAVQVLIYCLLLVCNWSSLQSPAHRQTGRCRVIWSKPRFPFEKRQQYLVDCIASRLVFLSFVVIFPPSKAHHHHTGQAWAHEEKAPLVTQE